MHVHTRAHTRKRAPFPEWGTDLGRRRQEESLAESRENLAAQVHRVGGGGGVEALHVGPREVEGCRQNNCGPETQLVHSLSSGGKASVGNWRSGVCGSGKLRNCKSIDGDSEVGNGRTDSYRPVSGGRDAFIVLHGRISIDSAAVNEYIPIQTSG